VIKPRKDFLAFMWELFSLCQEGRGHPYLQRQKNAEKTEQTGLADLSSLLPLTHTLFFLSYFSMMVHTSLS
jgi:hypothetical protein